MATSYAPTSLRPLGCFRLDPLQDPLDERGWCSGIGGWGVEQAVAGPGEGHDGEVPALSLDRVQHREALGDWDLAVGGAIQPQRWDPQLLKVGSGVRA
jgi:hypothetical protein